MSNANMKAETMSRIGGYIPHYESLRHGVESPQNFEVILELIIEFAICVWLAGTRFGATNTMMMTFK
jgi:hypothetical protein